MHQKYQLFLNQALGVYWTTSATYSLIQTIAYRQFEKEKPREFLLIDKTLGETIKPTDPNRETH